MPPPSEHSGAPIGALYALVLDLFTANEFRRWLRLGPDADIVPELPGESAADTAIVDQALGVLVRATAGVETATTGRRCSLPHSVLPMQTLTQLHSPDLGLWISGGF